MSINNTYAVILAGGFGTRLSEETHSIPKPMVEIDGMPIILHIMNSFSHFGVKKFIILGGYKQEILKSFFANYYLNRRDIEISLIDGNINFLNSETKDWNIKILDTGLNSMTGGRILKAKRYLENESNFFLTYGDGVSDVNLQDLYDQHMQSKDHIATITTVPQPSKFGAIQIGNDNTITSFEEKTMHNGGLINGGYMILRPEVFNYIENDNTVFEEDPLRNMCSNGVLKSFVHSGFWRAMDTLRDKMILEDLVQNKKAPWIY